MFGSQGSFSVDVKNLRKIFKRMTGEEALRMAQEVLEKRSTIAIVAQAIAYNFQVEGPGWAPLKRATIMASVSKAMKKRLITNKKGDLFDGKTGEKPRQILRRTNVGYKSVTTPGASGNIYRVRDMQIEWGTNLAYFGIHNRGGVIKHPGSKNAFGIKGLKTKPHLIHLPARPYLKMTEFWKTQLLIKVADDYRKGIMRLWKEGG